MADFITIPRGSNSLTGGTGCYVSHNTKAWTILSTVSSFSIVIPTCRRQATRARRCRPTLGTAASGSTASPALPSTAGSTRECSLKRFTGVFLLCSLVIFFPSISRWSLTVPSPQPMVTTKTAASVWIIFKSPVNQGGINKYIDHKM